MFARLIKYTFYMLALMPHWASGQSTALNKDYTYRYYLEISNPSVHDESFVVYSFERWGRVKAVNLSSGDTLSSGSVLPLSTRSLPTYLTAFSIEISQKSTINIEIIAKGLYSITTPKKDIWQYTTLQKFYQNDRTRLWQQGLFMGVIVIMGLYNLLIFISVKDISYLFYTLSIVSLGVYFSFYYGFGIELFWPNSPIWDIYAFSIIIPFTNWARVRFTYHYFDKITIQHKDKQLLFILEWICLLSICVHLVFYLTNSDYLRHIVTWIAIMGVTVLLVMLFYGIKGMNKGFIPARYFVLANLAFVLGAILFILRELGIFPDNFMTRYVVQLGVLVQVVLFSLGLASRINQEREKNSHLLLQKEIERQELLESQKLLLEEQVQEQTQSLRKANLLKTKILSIISHDLRNPIVSIGSFLNLMIDHKDRLTKVEQNLMASQVKQSLNYLDQLLMNLLHWSRSQSTRLTPQFDKVDITSVLRNAVEYHQLTIELKQLRIQIDDQQLLPIHGDTEMLNFVFRNILGNAIKFSNEGGKIHVKISNEVPDALQISIQDFGTGMSEVKISSLESSATLPSSTGTAKEKGAGLGLVICREFIQLHNGSLQIKSDGSSWTCVTVTLPNNLEVEG